MLDKMTNLRKIITGGLVVIGVAGIVTCSSLATMYSNKNQDLIRERKGENYTELAQKDMVTYSKNKRNYTIFGLGNIASALFTGFIVGDYFVQKRRNRSKK